MGMRSKTRNLKTRRSVVGSANPKGQRQQITRLIHQPSYPGEWVRQYSLPGPNQLISTSGTTFTFVYAIGSPSSQVLNWTDFSTLYDEYVIQSCHFKITCVTPPTPGVAYWFFDNSSSSLPTVNDCARNGAQMTQHSMNDHKIWPMSYKVIDYSLLSFRRTVVDYDVGYFKGITNAANFGTSAANTLLYSVQPFYSIVFRGRKV